MCKSGALWPVIKTEIRNSLGLSHKFDCWPHLAEQYIGVIHIAAERELFRLGASIEALMRCGGHERP
jgi:hypothetical protein